MFGDYFDRRPDGYRQSIQMGMQAASRFSGRMIMADSAGEEQIAQLREALDEAERIVIGAGAGLSTSAGFVYDGERFRNYFFDFEEKYGFHDMYSGGFYVMQLEPEITWAYWARNIYINRYKSAPRPVYRQLLELVEDKDYFVITTNVDHQFQRAGIDKSRLFYTQGDYGSFQSVDPEDQRTYDNEEWVMRAMEAQGFIKDETGEFIVPGDGSLCMRIPTELLPKTPDGRDVTMNLRSDDTFVEDEGWHAASERYAGFLQSLEGRRVLFLELGVGANTPVIIKYPFWQMTKDDPKATYACLNYSESYAPVEIRGQSICISGDIGDVLKRL